nr:hypothetical protein CFP56_79126 [Quercus suber]
MRRRQTLRELPPELLISDHSFSRRGRTVLVQIVSSQEGQRQSSQEGEFTGRMPAKVKSDLPPLSDSCDPTKPSNA